LPAISSRRARSAVLSGSTLGYENARQVEEAGEPGDDQRDMQGLDGQHRSFLGKAARIPASTVG
jgi:hypothetical protein